MKKPYMKPTVHFVRPDTLNPKEQELLRYAQAVRQEAEETAPAYCCKLCGDSFSYDEEALWGHLQMCHEAVFEEEQNLETPDMLEIYYDRIEN